MAALQILQWNCRSIQNKIPELKSYLANLPDILCLQETYLNKNIVLFLPGYKCIRKDRSNGKRGGGICICIKQNILFSEIAVSISHNDMESMAIKVSGIVILNVYNPPANPIDNNVLQFIANFCHAIICGEFNAHHKMWDAGSANQNGCCCRKCLGSI